MVGIVSAEDGLEPEPADPFGHLAGGSRGGDDDASPDPSSCPPPASPAASRNGSRTWKPERILVAFDADCAGDRAAERLVRADPRAPRMRPPRNGADWNDILKARREAFSSKRRPSPRTEKAHAGSASPTPGGRTSNPRPKPIKLRDQGGIKKRADARLASIPN